MDNITAEQAIEEAKGLTFEVVWAALMENRKQIEKTDKQIEKTQQQMDKTQQQMDKTQEQIEISHRETRTTLKELSAHIGGIGNTLGRMSEGLFSVGLRERFNELGYPFTKQGPHQKFYDKETDNVIAEADYFLENGDYAMAVEVKTELEISDVKDHIQRIEVIRGYFDERGDKRILVGAVAGVMIHVNVMNYALKQGLYVLTQTGDTVTVAELPQGFKAREW